MTKPLYTKIREYILLQIHSGAWQEQTLIPSERELAEQFNVSRITAKSAVLGLVNEGYLYRHRGKGTFVGSRPAQSAEVTASAESSSSSAPPPKRQNGSRAPPGAPKAAKATCSMAAALPMRSMSTASSPACRPPGRPGWQTSPSTAGPARSR